MKMKKIHCQYCGGRARRRPDSVVRGSKAKGVLLYVCERYPACDAYVGVHKDTLLPLGTLANRSLREKRRRAHEVFDTLWQSGMMTRSGAYAWLRATFSLSVAKGHIGLFSESMCEVLIAACEAYLQNTQIAA